jgi:hypothetical protein
MGGPGTFPVPQGGNSFAPMPPMPLAGMPPPPPMGGMPPPPMPQAPMPQPSGAGLGSFAGSNAPRRRMFGDFLESTLSSGQPRPAPQMARPPQMQQQQRMVAPGTPAMRTPPMQSTMPRPMMYGGEVDVFGYEDGGPVQYMSGGGVAKPNMREFMDATGATAAQASQALYGSVGSNKDIRDWDAIMASDNPLQATQAATSQMYSSGAAIAGDQRFYDDAGNYTPTAAGYGGVDVGASTGGPKLEILDGQVYITSSDGLPLTGLTAANAASFGITQDQIDAAVAAGGRVSGDVSNAGYVPYDAGNLLIDYSGSGYSGSGGVSSGSSGSSGSGSSSGQSSGASYDAVSQPVNDVVSQPVNVADSIDFSQFNGDVGKFSNTGENFALYGPQVNIPSFASQYISSPGIAGLTTTNGPEMTAVSGIGALNMPANSVDLDVLNWLSEPTYGSLDRTVEEMREGGAVPRQTMIGDDPHMLAYINQDEEALLRSFGGSGISGPGGIPSYPLVDLGVGATNTGNTYSGSSNAVSGGYSHPTDGDDDNNTSSNVGGNSATDFINKNDDNDDSGLSANDLAEIAAQAAIDAEDAAVLNAQKVAAANAEAAASMLSAGIGNVGGTNYNPTSNDDRITYNRYTDNETSALDDFADQQYNASFDLSDGSVIPGSVAGNLVGAQNTNLGSLYNDNNTINAVVDYNTNANNQNVGNTNVTTLTDSQLANAASDTQGATAAEILMDQQSAAAEAAAAAQAAAAAEAAKKAATASWFNSLPEPQFTSTFPGSGDSGSGSVAATINAPNSIFDLPPATGLPPASSDVGATDDDLATDYTKIAGVDVGATDDDLETDFSIFDTGADTGADEDENPLSLLRPANAGLGRGAGFKSIEQLKAEIAAAEGTADEGGYDRLLDKGETGTFSGNKPLTEMTLAEAIKFGTSDAYRNYSRDVLGRGPNELPSTPMGKYQIVGTTLAEIVNNPANGFDPNDLFDAETQEKLGEYIINKKRNYEDVLTGKITQAEFEKGLGQEFEGIQKDEDFSLSGGSVDKTGINQVDDKSTSRPTDDEVVKAAVEAAKPGASEDETAKIKAQLDASVPVQGFGKFIANIGKGLFFGLGEDFVQGLVDKTEAERANIVEMHMNAINNGATPKYDDDGKYVGYDTSTAATFGQKVLNYSQDNDISALLPPSLEGGDFKITQADIDEINRINKMYEGDQDKIGQGLAAGDTITLGSFTNDNAIDSGNARFQQVYDAQSKAAELDPYGMSTENGFITSDGEEYVVTLDGKLVKVEDGVVGTGESILNSGLGVGTEIATIFGDGDDTTATSGDDDTTTTTTEVDTGYTTDENGNKICNQDGYVYDVATDACVPAVAEESTDTSLNIGSGASRSFEDVLKNIQTKPTTIAPISANIKPMAQGGMAGLNRTADNFLRALGG